MRKSTPHCSADLEGIADTLRLLPNVISKDSDGVIVLKSRSKMDSVQCPIPVVDFSAWSNGSSEDKKRLAQELTEACRQVGFVYIINHGVPSDALGEAFSWSKKLFDLPEEKKMLAPHPPGRYRLASLRNAKGITNFSRSYCPSRILVAGVRESVAGHHQRW